MCPSMFAHWCHLANTIELVLPWPTFYCGTASFGVFCIKIRAYVLAVRDLKSPRNSRVNFCTEGAKSRMHGNETPYPISIKLCRTVGIHDVTTYANLCDGLLCMGFSDDGVK